MGIGAAQGAAIRKNGMNHHPAAPAAQPLPQAPGHQARPRAFDPQAQCLLDFRATTARYLGLADAVTRGGRQVPGATGSVACG